MDILLILVFILGIIMLSLVLRLNLFASLSIYLGFLLLVVFCLNLFGISASSLILSIILLLVGLVTLRVLGLSRKKTKTRDFHKADVKEFIKRKYLFYIAIFGLSFLVGILYFTFLGNDIDVPQYESVDAAIHYFMGKKFAQEGFIQYFSESIYFPDSVNLYKYPYGTSILSGLFMRSLSFIDDLAVFQVFNCFLYAFTNTYFLKIIFEKVNIKSRLLKFCLISMITLGFFLNLMTVGFTSQLLGLLFLLAVVDIYELNIKNTIKGVSISILLTAVFVTYFYWLPILAVYFFFRNFRNILFFRKNFKKIEFLFLVIILTSILSSHYVYIFFQSSMMNSVRSDGTSYKIFLANFVLLVPLVAGYLWVRLREFFKKFPQPEFPPILSLFLSSSLFTVVLMILYLLGVIESYTFAKSFYLFFPMIFVISVVHLDKLLKKAKIRYTCFFSLIFSVFVIFPFFQMDSTYTREVSLQLRFDDLNVKLFEIFHHNSQVINNPDAHPVSFSQDSIIFARRLSKSVPHDFQLDKVSVVAYGEESLWFYAMSDIYPRDIQNQESIWIQPLFSYYDWSSASSSDYLIILNNSAREDWLETNDFDISNFDVVYEYSGNVLLKYRE